MTDDSWRVRPYRCGDEDALVALWREVFGRPMSDAQWRWKAKGRSGPVENVGVAVGADDRPIFQFVGIPCPAVVAGRPRTVMVGADVVTAPAFRRRGVFTSTVRRLFESWRDAGVALVLGLANESAWGSRAAALGYERTFDLRWMIRPVRPERWLARRSRIAAVARLRALGHLWNRVWTTPAAPPGFSVRLLSTATPEIDTVWMGADVRQRHSLVRDRAWVAWRYCTAPDRDYRLTLAERASVPVGYASYRVERDEANGRIAVRVPEIFAPGDPLAVRALVRDLMVRATEADAEQIVTLAVPGSVVYRELRRSGFLFSPGAYRLEAVRLDPAIPSSVLHDAGSWWVAGGDFDVI